MNKTFLAFSCVHIPFQDKGGVKWLLDAIEDKRPDVVVCLGDLFDANAASRWPNEYKHTLEEEYVGSNDLLKTIRKDILKDKSTCVWLKGNHEANVLAPCRVKKDLRSLVSFEKHIDEHTHWLHRPYIYHPLSGTYRLGQVTFAHGYEAGQNGDARQSVRLGVPYGLAVLGHTHRPERVTQTRLGGVDLPYHYVNTGSFINMNPPPQYVMRSNTQRWGQGYVHGEAKELKSPRLSRNWDAELVVRKMAWDD